MHHERHCVHVGLVADSVRRAARQWNHITRAGSHVPRRTVPVAHIEGELTLEDVVDLARIVSVDHGWTAAGWHADLNGEQVAAGLRAGR